MNFSRGLTLLFLLVCIHINLFSQNNKVSVALFKGHGGSETCVWETEAALGMDKSLRTDIITAADMTYDRLKEYDVIVVPGGGGSRQYLNMGGLGREALKQFVAEGGGIVGICAGAYLISSTPDYSCLEMSGALAHDIEHDNRGRGISIVSLTPNGKTLFPELEHLEKLFLMYYEGPVALQNPNSQIIFDSFATMESDVHVEGDAPANMTNNKTFLYAAQYGKGSTMSVVGHPEATPGMQWMISRLVHYVSPKKVEPSLDVKFISPYKFNDEFLMTQERREKEQGAFKILLNGSSAEKIEQLEWLVKHNSWDAKRWIQGLIHDDDPQVRKRTIELVGWAMYRMYLPDLHTALKRETNPDIKSIISKVIEELQ